MGFFVAGDQLVGSANNTPANCFSFYFRSGVCGTLEAVC